MGLPSSAESPMPDRRDATAMRFIAALAMTGAAVWLIGALTSVLMPLFGGQGLSLSLLPGGGGFSALPDGVAALPEGVRYLTARTLAVTVDPASLSSGTVALLLTEAGLTNLVGAIVAGAIAYALRRIARGEAFHRSMFGVAVTTGCALTFGMLTATGLGGLGRMMAGDELNTLLGDNTFLVGFEASPVPVLLGFAVLGLAMVFRVGERLQRDTAGLV